MTLSEAKSLSYRDILHYRHAHNADGTPQRWRVNGKPTVWKRSPNRVRVPVKHGLYSFGYVDEHNLSEFDVA